MILTGVCRYCGQVHTFESDEQLTDKERDHKALLLCNCDAAKVAARTEKSRNQAHDNIAQLCKDEPDLAKLMNVAVDIISTGAIASATADDGNGIKVTVKITSKGNIKTTLKKENKWEIEA